MTKKLTLADFRSQLVPQPCKLGGPDHEPMPTSYLLRAEYATLLLNSGRKQEQCPKCRLWAIWVFPEEPELPEPTPVDTSPPAGPAPRKRRKETERRENPANYVSRKLGLVFTPGVGEKLTELYNSMAPVNKNAIVNRAIEVYYILRKANAESGTVTIEYEDGSKKVLVVL